MVNTLELLQIYMHIETNSVCFDLVLENLKGRICTIMSSFFLCCKTKTVNWQAKELLFTV